MFDDPQVRHRGMALDIDVDGATALNPGVAIKLSDTPGSVRFPTPLPAAHTDEILGVARLLRATTSPRCGPAGAV